MGRFTALSSGCPVVPERSALGVADLHDRRIPVVPRPIDDPERVRIDDELPVGVLGDVKELQRLRGGILEDDGGALVVLRSVTGAVEPILGVAPRHGAAEMRALAIRSDDPAGWVE